MGGQDALTPLEICRFTDMKVCLFTFLQAALWWILCQGLAGEVRQVFTDTDSTES